MSEEKPTPEQPTPEEPVGERPAESAHPAPEGADEPTVQAPVQGQVPPGFVPPPGSVPPPGAVPPGQGYYYPPGVPMQRPRSGFGTFVRHRATQIVAAAVLGLLVGGGTIALVDSAPGGPAHGHHHYLGNYGSGHGNVGPGGAQGYARPAPGGN
jgi:hypothetical protein